MGDPFDFEKALRAERRLNVTVRLLRLMAALSERSGYASMSVDNMARELNSEPGAIRQARQKVVRLGYFHAPKKWKYHRRRSEGEEKVTFWDRMQRDRRLDLVARCTFLLADLTKKSGSVSISFAELGQKLNVDYDVSRAVKRVLELDQHFRKSGDGRNSYQRIWGIFDGPETADAPPDPDDEEVFAHWRQRGRARQRAGADRE